MGEEHWNSEQITEIGTLSPNLMHFCDFGNYDQVKRFSRKPKLDFEDVSSL